MKSKGFPFVSFWVVVEQVLQQDSSFFPLLLSQCFVLDGVSVRLQVGAEKDFRGFEGEKVVSWGHLTAY